MTFHNRRPVPAEGNRGSLLALRNFAIAGALTVAAAFAAIFLSVKPSI
jgi:hypothetical protein